MRSTGRLRRRLALSLGGFDFVFRQQGGKQLFRRSAHPDLAASVSSHRQRDHAEGVGKRLNAPQIRSQGAPGLGERGRAWH